MLFCNIVHLIVGFRVRLYIEDSLGERTWVDQEDCKTFVDGVLTAFGTKMPNR
jgi:hypothetical protein